MVVLAPPFWSLEYFSLKGAESFVLLGVMGFAAGNFAINATHVMKQSTKTTAKGTQKRTCGGEESSVVSNCDSHTVTP